MSSRHIAATMPCQGRMGQRAKRGIDGPKTLPEGEPRSQVEVFPQMGSGSAGGGSRDAAGWNDYTSVQMGGPGDSSRTTQRESHHRALDARLSTINSPTYRARPTATFAEFANRWDATVLSQHKPSTQSAIKSQLRRVVMCRELSDLCAQGSGWSEIAGICFQVATATRKRFGTLWQRLA